MMTVATASRLARMIIVLASPFGLQICPVDPKLGSGREGRGTGVNQHLGDVTLARVGSARSAPKCVCAGIVPSRRGRCALHAVNIDGSATRVILHPADDMKASSDKRRRSFTDRTTVEHIQLAGSGLQTQLVETGGKTHDARIAFGCRGLNDERQCEPSGAKYRIGPGHEICGPVESHYGKPVLHGCLVERLVGTGRLDCIVAAA